MTNNVLRVVKDYSEGSGHCMTRRDIHLPEAEFVRMYEATVVSRHDVWLTNASGKVMLVERRTEPHADWWLPGGRFRPGMEPREAVADRVRRDLGLNVEIGRLTEIGTEHYQWGMPSYGVTAQLFGLIWRAELSSVEEAGLRVSTKYRQLSWCDPIELAESRGIYDPSLTRIARNALAHCRR